MNDTIDRPAAMMCPRCERIHQWTWQEAIPWKGGTIAARWARPDIRELDGEKRIVCCPRCRPQAEADLEEGRILGRLKRMGVPKYARGWTLKDIEYQNDIELDQRFRDRVMSHVRLYGVPRHNEESVRAAVRWLDYLRGQDAENSAVGLYIHGPVGTGKTLLAAILCRALMGGVERVWTRYSDAYIARSLGRTPTPEDLEDPMWQGYAAARSMPVMWVSEGEIMRRQKLSWKGDESPLLQVSTFKGLVIYDEAGAETASTSGRVPEWKIEAFERMITRRIDRGSPLLLTSNIPARVGFGQVEGKSSPWGARVADRLRGSVVPLALKGSSWRQV